MFSCGESDNDRGDMATGPYIKLTATTAVDVANIVTDFIPGVLDAEVLMQRIVLILPTGRRPG